MIKLVFYSVAVLSHHVFLRHLLHFDFLHSVQIAVRWWEGGTVMSSVLILRVNVPSDLSTVKLCPADPSAP